MIRLRRHALGLGTAILAIAGVAIAAAPATPVVAQTQLQVGLPTIVDPVRAVGEPDIAVDNQNNAWISGPAGSSTQTSFYWHSLDGGLTYPMLGPGAGHWVCPASGGGDSLIEVDRVNGNVDLTDQEALASLGTGRTAGDGSNLNSKCLATPAMSADRPFEAILHPATSVKAPQYLANGNTPLTYLSWLCDACGTGVPGNLGGLAFAWTADGVNWHAADAGVPADNLVTNQFFEATSINSFHWHGTMVADPVTGYIFTGLSCSGSCVNGKTDNEFGVAEGKPACSAGPNCPSPGTQADASNVGEFASETYNEASGSYNGQPWPEPGSLFPVLTQDSNRTLYLAWIEGDGSVTTGSPPAASWHAYYAYSTDLPDHKVWSAPIRIDRGAQDLTNAMTWVAAGDAGKLAAIWLSSPVRMYPSDQSNQTRPWYPHMAVSTNANTANPSFQEVQVSGGPNHIGDVCLNGTLCGASSPPGNRNMADFISVDIGPDGAAQATWASDANQLSTLPTSIVPGAPVTETARQVSGPMLVGSGDVSDSRFSTTPTTIGVGDATGDALYPVWPRSGAGAGSNIPQLDLTGSRIEWDGTNIKVHISAADLSNLASPDTTNQTHVWWLTTWQENSKIFFAKAESDGGGALTFTAGAPATYDRPGLTYYTIPTLVDYRGGTSVNGVKNGNEFVVTVPPNLVGNVGAGAVLQSVTGYSVLDNGSPPIVTVGATGAPEDNMPTIADATPAYNAVLAASTSTSPPTISIAAPPALPNTAAVVLQLPAPLRVGLGGLLVALALVALVARRALGRHD